MLVRPNQPHPYRDKPTVTPEPPTALETVEVIFGFFVMLFQVGAGCLTAVVGLIGAVISLGLLGVLIAVVGFILLVLFS
jgi:hypothetical protein